MALFLGIGLFLTLSSLLNNQEENTTTKEEQCLITVSQIFIYPVKSCAGVQVKSALVTETGFEHDRQWIVVERGPNGTWEMVHQRQHPSMVLIRPEVIVNDDGNLSLALEAPNMERIVVPRTYEQVPISATVWESPVFGSDQGDQASKWLSEYLKRPVRLLVKHPNYIRPLKQKHTPASSFFTHEPQTAFADGYPFLILSEESINHFMKQFTPQESKRISIRNFRPNIVVKGGTNPFMEDNWLLIRVGNDNTLVITHRCTRCEMTNNDPNTGESPATSTTTTLKELMKTRRVDKGTKYEACMGVNSTPTSSGKHISVGDAVVTLMTGELDLRGVWQGGLTPIKYQS